MLSKQKSGAPAGRFVPRSPQLHDFSVCDFTLQSTGFLGAVAETAHLCALTQGLVPQQFREQFRGPLGAPGTAACTDTHLVPSQ